MLFIGVNYGRGAQKHPIDDGCEKAPLTIQSLYNNDRWIMLYPQSPFNQLEIEKDRFSENFIIQKQTYDLIKSLNKDEIENHIFIGGDHSLNFAHFKAIKDSYPNEEIGLIYIDAHLDIHTPQSSKEEASGSPHGTNVRHLLGQGDSRYLQLGTSTSPLKKENLFYIGTRSYEPSEINYINENNIFITNKEKINDINYLLQTTKDILTKLNGKKYIISFDFDVITPTEFSAVQVPEANGISIKNIIEILKLLNTKNLICSEFLEYAPKFDKYNTSKNIVKTIIDIMKK